MKLKALVAVIALSSTTAMACPDLAGSYLCPGEAGDTETTVSQTVTNGVTVYTVDEGDGPYELIADGQTRTQTGQTQTGNSATMDLTNVCQKLVLVSTANYSEKDPAGKAVGSFKYVQKVSRAANGGLALDISYSENGGPAQVGKGVCAKK